MRHCTKFRCDSFVTNLSLVGSKVIGIRLVCAALSWLRRVLRNSLVIKAILSVFSTLLYTSGEPWPKTIAQSDVTGSVLTSSSRLTNRQDGFRNDAMYYYAK